MAQLAKFIRNPRYLVIIILVASGITHLWNAAAFPDVFFDEGVYMRRAMHVLSGAGPQEGYFYDHPYFGQLFLASILGLSGFPASLHPSPNPGSISTLYLEPRIVMGLLAVADTFLVYKIAQGRYGQKIGLMSSTLFAVMPFTWVVRRILLDSILLPFMLLSVYLALCSKNSRRQDLLIMLSGACLGIALFTKVIVFVLIPLVAGLVYFGNGKKAKHLLLFLIPVILIPSIWPIYSMEEGQFGFWIKGIVYQTERPSYGLPYISFLFLQMDPVLFALGIGGTAYCILRKDWFMVMWFAPFVILLLAIGYNQYFYWIPILPVFCIGGAILIARAAEMSRQSNPARLASIAMLCIAAFGLASTLYVINTNMSHSQYEAAAYVLQNVKENDNQTTILSSPAYSWIFSYVFHRPNVPPDYSVVLYKPITTAHVLLISDLHYRTDLGRGYQMSQYNSLKTVATFDVHNPYDMRYYPYTSLWSTWEGSNIEIKER